MKRNLTPVFVALTLFAAFGIVGGMDYEDAKTQQALYCDNVKSGVWPDYEGTYVSECEKEHGPKRAKSQPAQRKPVSEALIAAQLS